MVQRGYKTELKLNNKQRTYCLKHTGVARFTFNWGLAQKKLAYEKGEKIPNAIELHRRLNAIKLTELPWMYEVSKCSPQEALRDLDRAFINFFLRNVQNIQNSKVRKMALAAFACTALLKLVITIYN